MIKRIEKTEVQERWVCAYGHEHTSLPAAENCEKHREARDGPNGTKARLMRYKSQRDALIARLHEAGKTQQFIADALGYSSSRIGELIRRNARCEREYGARYWDRPDVH